MSGRWPSGAQTTINDKVIMTKAFNKIIHQFAGAGLCALVIFSTIGIGCSPSRTTESSRVTGTWLGKIIVPGLELRTGFIIRQTTNGTLGGTLSSIDQGAMNIPLDEVICTNNHLTISLQAMRASFEGTVEADGKTINGKWKQGGGELPLALQRVAKLPELNRPQTPTKPHPYREEEVRFQNSRAAITLAGTLTLPKSQGPFPAVILLTGSGPQNRDEELFQHKPFLVLSDYLTRRGIAVLRMDDRGVGGSTGDFFAATTGDFAEDALAGVAFLKSRKEIKPDGIGLVGHSEGGMMAPIAAAQSRDVGFVVMLAGTGVPFGEVVVGQITGEIRRQGAPNEVVEAIRAWHLKMYEIVGKATDDATAEKELRNAFNALDANARQRIDWTPAKLDQELPGLLKPWWRYAMRYSPKTTLEQVRCPVLALNGSKDTQVIAADNLKSITEALKVGRNSHSATRELSGLNHMFQTAQTGAESEYVQIEETMAPVAMQTLGDWILQLPCTSN